MKNRHALVYGALDEFVNIMLQLSQCMINLQKESLNVQFIIIIMNSCKSHILISMLGQADCVIAHSANISEHFYFIFSQFLFFILILRFRLLSLFSTVVYTGV